MAPFEQKMGLLEKYQPLEGDDVGAGQDVGAGYNAGAEL